MVTVSAAAILLQRFFGKRSLARNDKLASGYNLLGNSECLQPYSSWLNILAAGGSYGLPFSCWQS